MASTLAALRRMRPSRSKGTSLHSCRIQTRTQRLLLAARTHSTLRGKSRTLRRLSCQGCTLRIHMCSFSPLGAPSRSHPILQLCRSSVTLRGQRSIPLRQEHRKCRNHHLKFPWAAHRSQPHMLFHLRKRIARSSDWQSEERTIWSNCNEFCVYCLIVDTWAACPGTTPPHWDI